MRKLALLGGFLVALAFLAVACKGVPKLARVPKTPDIIIKADEAYLEGEERERDLSLKHYKALENIIAGVRNVFPEDPRTSSTGLSHFPLKSAATGAWESSRSSGLRERTFSTRQP